VDGQPVGRSEDGVKGREIDAARLDSSWRLLVIASLVHGQKPDRVTRIWESLGSKPDGHSALLEVLEVLKAWCGVAPSVQRCSDISCPDGGGVACCSAVERGGGGGGLVA
jgi:hypothetical protein